MSDMGLTENQIACKRVLDSINKQCIDPFQTAVAAYINSTLQAARVSAVVEFMTTEGNATWTPKERLDALIVKYLNQVADELDKAAAAVPRIITGKVNGH